MMGRLQLLMATAVFAAAGLTGTSASADEHEVVSGQTVAMVRVVVRDAEGKTTRSKIRAVPFGESASFDLRSGAHKHRVSLVPTSGDGLSVEFDYTRDGTVLEDDRDVAVRSRRATTLHVDNEARVIVTVIPTRVSISVSQ